jgi:hypothetical protein
MLLPQVAPQSASLLALHPGRQHPSPAAHVVRRVHAEGLAPGEQISQGLAGLAWPDVYATPLMRQPGAQVAPAAEHTWPNGQLSGASQHAVVGMQVLPQALVPDAHTHVVSIPWSAHTRPLGHWLSLQHWPDDTQRPKRGQSTAGEGQTQVDGGQPPSALHPGRHSCPPLQSTVAQHPVPVMHAPPQEYCPLGHWHSFTSTTPLAPPTMMHCCPMEHSAETQQLLAVTQEVPHAEEPVGQPHARVNGWPATGAHTCGAAHDASSQQLPAVRHTPWHSTSLEAHAQLPSLQAMPPAQRLPAAVPAQSPEAPQNWLSTAGLMHSRTPPGAVHFTSAPGHCITHWPPTQGIPRHAVPAWLSRQSDVAPQNSGLLSGSTHWVPHINRGGRQGALLGPPAEETADVEVPVDGAAEVPAPDEEAAPADVVPPLLPRLSGRQ